MVGPGRFSAHFPQRGLDPRGQGVQEQGHPRKRCPEVNDMRALRALSAHRRAATLDAR